MIFISASFRKEVSFRIKLSVVTLLSTHFLTILFVSIPFSPQLSPYILSLYLYTYHSLSRPLSLSIVLSISPLNLLHPLYLSHFLSLSCSLSRSLSHTHFLTHTHFLSSRHPQWRAKIKQLTRETEERNRLLLDEKRSIQRHYQLLKQRIEVYRFA